MGSPYWCKLPKMFASPLRDYTRYTDAVTCADCQELIRRAEEPSAVHLLNDNFVWIRPGTLCGLEGARILVGPGH